jgi:hypothetical protein
MNSFSACSCRVNVFSRLVASAVAPPHIDTQPGMVDFLLHIIVAVTPTRSKDLKEGFAASKDNFNKVPVLVDTALAALLKATEISDAPRSQRVGPSLVAWRRSNLFTNHQNLYNLHQAMVKYAGIAQKLDEKQTSKKMKHVQSEGEPSHLDLDMFCQFCLELWLGCVDSLNECLLAYFTSVDKNGDGLVSLNVFKQMVMTLDNKMSPHDAEDMFRQWHDLSPEGDDDALTGKAWVQVARQFGMCFNLSESERNAVNVLPDALNIKHFATK